jgi:hypothetical protein
MRSGGASDACKGGVQNCCSHAMPHVSVRLGAPAAQVEGKGRRGGREEGGGLVEGGREGGRKGRAGGEGGREGRQRRWRHSHGPWAPSS